MNPYPPPSPVGGGQEKRVREVNMCHRLEVRLKTSERGSTKSYRRGLGEYTDATLVHLRGCRHAREAGFQVTRKVARAHTLLAVYQTSGLSAANHASR